MVNRINLLKKISLKITLLLEILIVVLMNFFLSLKIPVCASAASVKLGSRWMSELSDNVNLCDINIPGTHDSGTTYTAGVVTGLVASCQDDTIPEQLKKGIRYLDIRCDSNLNINHGGVACYSSFLTVKKYKLTFPKLLDEVEKFLKDNPSETIFLQLKEEGIGKGDFSKNINSELKNRSTIYVPETSRPSDIKLKDLRGKILICSRTSGIDLAYNYRGWADNCDCSDLLLDRSGCILQDKYNSHSAKDKLSVIESFYEKVWSKGAENKFVINFTSCVGPYCPEYIAKKINPKFESYVKQNKGKKFGIILMDVPKESLISAIYSSNFSDAKSSAVPQV